MEMCYDGTLVMPKNYAVVSEEEMTYVDGGWAVETHWWGYYVYLTHKERVLLTDGQLIASGVAAVANVIAGAACGALTSIIWNHDDGYGVRLRYTAGVFTGVSALSASQEKKKAKKNKFI